MGKNGMGKHIRGAFYLVFSLCWLLTLLMIDLQGKSSEIGDSHPKQQ